MSQAPRTLAPHGLADYLNRNCACQLLDPARLGQELTTAPSLSSMAQNIAHTHPHLFSATPLYINPGQLAQLQALIRTIDQVVQLPAWQDQALRHAPLSAQHQPSAHGVFFGYDFHLTPAGVQLIEINTNAGGAYLSLALARAQNACCQSGPALAIGTQELAGMEQRWLDMFCREWQAQGRTAPLRSVAIVDEDPAGQYLYPEFLLFQQLLAQAGIRCQIAAPSELSHHDGGLYCRDERIDLVYNRLTDFYFESDAAQALRDAYLSNTVVVTPHPRAHALYASKHHLVTLSDAQQLAALGVDCQRAQLLTSHVPPAQRVHAGNADELWASRREWFFKPAAGYGSKAAWRGDKLTRRNWDYLVQSDYIAQALTPPAARRIRIAQSDEQLLKSDLRAYVYRGEIQLLTARLYQGQTTNFRTQGGGFAPVYLANN